MLIHQRKANEMLHKNTIIEILLLTHQGRTQKEVSEKLGVSVGSVRKYSSRGKNDFIRIERTKRGLKKSKLDPYINTINELLINSPDISASRVLNTITNEGYSGSITIVQEYISKNIGRLLANHKNDIAIKLLKANLYQCMIKGISYLEYIKTKAPPDKPNKQKGLSENERFTIIRRGKSGDFKSWRFGVVIDMIALGVEFNTISKIMNVALGTVRNYDKCYRVNGIKKVKRKLSHKYAKAKNAQSKEKLQRIFEIIHHPPKFFDVNRSRWTQTNIANVYEKTYGETIGKSTIGDILKKSGYSLKKVKRVLTSSDPNYREKVELLLKTLQLLKTSEAFFFIDEVGPMRIKKYGGKIYTKKENTNYVSTNQTSKGSVSFSASLNATTNQLTWIYGLKKNTNCMIDLIEILFNQYFYKKKLYITWDAASWHSSAELVEWLNLFNKETLNRLSGPTIEFVPLPSCAQFLNVIESTFSHLKKAVVHNSNYQSSYEMMSAISGYFKERNEYFLDNPKRAGKKIWEIDFFKDNTNIKSGNFREW